MLPLSLVAALSYFLESVFGFGGTVLLVSVGSFIIDFKIIIYLSIWLSMLASIFVLATGYTSFSWVRFIEIMKITLPGLVIGTFVLHLIDGPKLLIAFSLLMVVYALQGLVYPTWHPSRRQALGLVALGGLVQGLYSTGGPFVVAGFRGHFTNKSELRSVVAGFFLLTNMWRVGQIALSGDHTIFTVLPGHWLAFAGLPVAVYLGHRVHMLLTDRQFRVGLLVLILSISAFHIVKALF